MKRALALFLAIAGALPAAAPARAQADAAEALASARGAFLAGRYDDAESTWRYLSELGIAAPEIEANLALTLRDEGRHEAATAQWLKASLLEGADGFSWNQRGWSYMATGRLREARDIFTARSTAPQQRPRRPRQMSDSDFHSSSMVSRRPPTPLCAARASPAPMRSRFPLSSSPRRR